MSGLIGAIAPIDSQANLLAAYLQPAIISGLGPWAWGLQPASWRGVRFAVLGSKIHRGRRTAVHQYPYRDEVWVEDLGRGLRSVSFRGFLIGDDVYIQRDAFSSACDVSGPGTLVHPSIGSLTVSVVEFSAGEDAQRGRVVELDLTFVENSQSGPLFPSTVVSTQSNTLLAAATADVASASDYLSDVGTAIGFGTAVVSAGQSVVLSWSNLARAAVSDASLIAGTVTGLPGINGGRFANGSLAVQQPVGTTAESAILNLTAAREQVSTDCATAATAVPDDAPAAVQAVAADVLATAQNPADQVRLLASLASFSPTIASESSPIGAAIVQMQTSGAALCRRASLTALARATAAYQPISYDDATAVLDTVSGVLEPEIISAADAGDTASYSALRALSTAITQDMIARGSSLPTLTTVRRGTSLPSLVLAYELYGDATQSDALVAMVDPVAPLWMPTEFLALSS